MIEANLKDHILSVKLRIIAKVNRQFLKEWQYELDHNRIFPFSKKNLPNRLFSHSRVNLSRTCKFDPAELISKYKLNVDGILHIGAHKGEEIESYLAAGVKNAAFVEPLEENFLILEKKVKLHSGYTAYKYAAGDEDKQIKIHLASNDLQSSSILKPAMHLKQNPEVLFNGEEEVELKRIDNLIFPSRLNFWVIDVQGYEMKTLNGAKQKINECDFIFIEINRAEVYENCTKVKDLDRYLYQLGFRRVLSRWWSLWGDGFYVRKEKLPMEF